MAEYIWDDLIYNPNLVSDKDFVGKKVYFGDNPSEVLDYANNDYHIGTLIEINKQDLSPFVIEYEHDTYEYGCIIVKKEEPLVSSKNKKEPYSERAKRWIKENNLKAGDYVRVTRKAEDYEDGYRNIWAREMNNYIGKTLKVLKVNSFSGLIILECDDTGYDFPYFVLEKVEPPKPQYVPFESMEEFIESFRSHNSYYLHENENALLSYGMWLKSKDEEAYKLVSEIWDDGVVIGDRKMLSVFTDQSSSVFNNTTSWEELLEEYEFLDRSPCGKEVKDE